ncbi:MAG: hypothetical protein PHN84_12795 [Desulfuromonadaceae bacterium]|nr:hypothetical protein [Desulfuromonadaceae bacterium]
MKTDSSITYATPYVQHFFDTVCVEESAAKRILSLLYPDGPKCASCGASITGRRALVTFWRGERTFCSSCGCKFSPNTGTILANAQLTYQQFEVILVLLSLDVDHKRIATMTGAHPDTIGIWHPKIKYWESHA